MNTSKEHTIRNLGGEVVPSGIVRCSVIREWVRVIVDQKIDGEFQRRMKERRLAEEKKAKIALDALNNPERYTVIIGQDEAVTYVRVL